MKVAVLGAALPWLVALLSVTSVHGSTMPNRAVKVTPLQKVVVMLQDMVKKGEEEKHEEQVQFAAFKQFCDDVSLEKEEAIKKANLMLEVLKAEIEKHDTEAQRLEGEIKGHEAEVVSWQSDSDKADAVRKTESDEYFAMHGNYTESLSALREALRVLKTQKGLTKGVYLMLKKVHPILGQLGRRSGAFTAAHAELEAFLSRASDEPDLSFSPPVAAYEFRSTDIVKMLEQLRDKFRDELTALEKEETKRRHDYMTLSQDLQQNMAAADSSIKSKQSSARTHKQQFVDKSATYKDISASRDADIVYLKDLKADCTKKEDEFNSRQALRTQEIDALEKAISILSSTDVSDAADKHLPALLQTLRAGLHGIHGVERRAGSLVQLSSQGDQPGQLDTVLKFLKTTSSRLGSHVLSAVVMRARDEPFAKVKRLIEELLTRLRAQATAEAEHKGWCDTEIATNTHTRKSKTQQVETLRADIESLTASTAQLKKDIGELSTETGKIKADMNEAEEIRSNETKENTKTIDEAAKAQKAVTQAVEVLKKFYTNASKATVLTQAKTAGRALQRRQEPPPLWEDDDPFQGQQAASGGIFAMLEVIQSDFARLESDTTTAEAAAAKAHKAFLEDSKISLVQKETDIKHFKSDLSDKEALLLTHKASLDDAEKLLLAAESEYDNLKKACMDEGQTYEERVQHRRDEIEALKKALAILSGDLA